MKVEVSVEGFADLDRALGDLSRAAGRRALRKALRAAAEPIASEMRSKTRGGLRESITVSNKLAPRQARISRRIGASTAAVELFVGPSYELGSGGRAAHLIEFGTQQRVQETTGRATGRIKAAPFARPAWDNNKSKSLGIIRTQLWQEIKAATARAEAKALRAARKAARNAG